jgi:lysozyme family protein
MADAEKLKPIILKWEGGFSNKKSDRGGATNKGITLTTFRSFYGSQKSVTDLKDITDEQWMNIFKTGYWNKFLADNIDSQSIANICVDWAWGSGAKTAVKKVQEILGVTVDGITGNQTLSAINKADAKTLFQKIWKRRKTFFENIVKNDPTQKVNLKGWLNRLNDFKFED